MKKTILTLICIAGAMAPAMAQIKQNILTTNSNNATLSNVVAGMAAVYLTPTQIQALFPGTLITNGSTVANVLSNNLKVDITHSLTASNLTASRVVLSGADKAFASAAASGAVPIDADGSAATAAQINATFPGIIITNGGTVATVLSNNFATDITHSMTASNLTASRVVLSGADKAFASAAASGAVPIDADGSATLAAQINALFPSNIITNNYATAFTVSNNLTLDVTRYLFLGTGLAFHPSGSATTLQLEEGTGTLRNLRLAGQTNTALVNGIIGFASYSSDATVALTATGLTNALGKDGTAYVTATAVAFTIKDRGAATLYTSPVISATVSVHLQNGWSVNAASGLAGTLIAD